MTHIKSIYIISFLLFIWITPYAQNDIFLVQGLPKETVSNKVKSCNIYSVDTKGVRNLELSKQYDNKGLLNIEVDFTNSNITKYMYNNIARIGELENLYFEGGDTSLILSKSVSVFFYNESKQIERIETTDSSSKEIIRFVYDEYNRIKEKKCVNNFDSLLWVQNYSYDTLYDGIVEVNISTTTGFTNKEFFDSKGRRIKSKSDNLYNFCLYKNNTNLQRMFEQISFDSNGDVNYTETELFFYNKKDLLSQKEVYINGQLESVFILMYNDYNLLYKINVSKDGNINSTQCIEIYEYDYYP